MLRVRRNSLLGYSTKGRMTDDQTASYGASGQSREASERAKQSRFRYFDTSPEIISLAVMRYGRVSFLV